MKEVSSWRWPASMRRSRSQAVSGHKIPLRASIGTISVQTRCGMRNAGRRTQSQRQRTPTQTITKPVRTKST